MIFLDTNVVSELVRPTPNSYVADWVNSQRAETTFLSVITEAELWYGVKLLPAGRRRNELASDIEWIIEIHLGGRVVDFDRDAVHHFASIYAARRQAGRPIRSRDCMIAATARSYAATVATRDIRGFQDCGIEVVNPWGRS